jgi:NAD(P)-dependent dehydrogenase (short-subunit alcohol dehydrogenase family)
MNEFQNKVAIVIGGTSGIGRAAAVAYAREGARVVVAGRRAAEGEETVRLLGAQGGEGFFVTTDVSKAAQVKEPRRTDAANVRPARHRLQQRRD